MLNGSANLVVESENSKHPFNRELCQVGADQESFGGVVVMATGWVIDDESKLMFSEDGRRIEALCP